MVLAIKDLSRYDKLQVLEPESDPAWDCITAYHCWLEDLLWQVQFKHHKIGKNQSSSKVVQSNYLSFPFYCLALIGNRAGLLLTRNIAFAAHKESTF